uniref:Uncharacterized protein n=1 Tax=Caenorhabditis japonica TaxID=281687 RepID=A0A8R1IIY5_CAEJA
MEDNESEVMKVEMALDVLDGTRTSGTKGSELSVEKRHVDVKQRRKLFKNFFKVESGSVVSAMPTNGWERSKRRNSKWEKEVEVLAKPNFRGPPKSRAQVRAKAKAGFGQFIRMETENEGGPAVHKEESKDRCRIAKHDRVSAEGCTSDIGHDG